MEAQRNDHHFLWERRHYKQRPYQALRNLVVARNVLIQPHRELHAALDPPIQPSRPLAHGILNHLATVDLVHPLDSAFETVDYLHQVGNAETIILADHLTEQLNYLVGSYE